MPDQGRVEMDMGALLQRAESDETVQVLKGDLPVILALGPAALGGWPSIEEAAVSVVAQLGDRVQLKGNDFVDIFLFRKVAVHPMIGDGVRQPVSVVVQLLLVEIPAGLPLLVAAWPSPRRGVSGRRRA